MLHKVEGLCCGTAKLDGSQTVQRLSNPLDVSEVPHSVANPSACSDCLNLILKKNPIIIIIIITPSLLLLLIPTFLFTVFYL